MERSLRGRQRKRSPRHRTGCFACTRNHNTNKVKMAAVVHPDRGEGTVQVCMAQADNFTRAS